MADRAIVTVRELAEYGLSTDGLSALLCLYGHLNPGDPKLDVEALPRDVWNTILKNPWLHYFGVFVDDRLVSTCNLAIIPNLTRNCQPYGSIENVVTHPDHRGRGFGTLVLKHALRLAWDKGCYKVLLQTGTKNENKLRFYQKAGFQLGVKTGFVAYPENTTGGEKLDSET